MEDINQAKRDDRLECDIGRLHRFLLYITISAFPFSQMIGSCLRSFNFFAVVHCKKTARKSFLVNMYMQAIPIHEKTDKGQQT